MKLSVKNIFYGALSCVALSCAGVAQTVAPASPATKVSPKEDTGITVPAQKVIPAEKVSPDAKLAAKKSAEIAKVKPDVKSALKPKIYGWKEWVWVIKPEVILRAKLDTGARTCSVHATNIEEVEIDGKKWVKFTVSDPVNDKASRIRYKAPLVRVSKIKNDAGGIDERFVVALTFQIGERKLVGEFNLNDRSKMTCAMLIGRNILEEIGYVDSAKTDLHPKPKRPNSGKPGKPRAPAKSSK